MSQDTACWTSPLVWGTQGRDMPWIPAGNVGNGPWAELGKQLECRPGGVHNLGSLQGGGGGNPKEERSG